MSKTPRRELVASAVRAELARRGMTGAELQAATAIPADVLTERLAGTAPFDVDQLQSVAVALDVDVLALLGPDARQG
jgi:hypothetical protein